MELPEHFPSDDVPPPEGTVTGVNYDESPADSRSPYQKWSVTIVPASGRMDEAIQLFQSGEWTWDEDNHTLAHGSDNWLFKDDYWISLSPGTGGGLTVSPGDPRGTRVRLSVPR